VTPGELPESSDGIEGSDSISASETRSGALEVVGRLGSTGGAAKVAPPEAWRPSGSGKPAGEDGRGETESEMSKAGEEESSLSERPGHHRPRRLADWINPTGARKVHSLIDKVYKRKNLEIAWERVRANHGAGGIDGESIEAFGEGLEERLARLHEELRTDSYAPQPVRQVRIPKAGKPGEWRMLGIPTIFDRVCQQALLNRLEPIFEPVFDDANFGYRRGRSTKDALRKVWKEIEAGREWIVDADLKDFFGSVDHEKLLALVAQRVSDGRILRLIEAMLTAGSYGEGRLFPTERGTPQGGVVGRRNRLFRPPQPIEYTAEHSARRGWRIVHPPHWGVCFEPCGGRGDCCARPPCRGALGHIAGLGSEPAPRAEPSCMWVP
jgi:retron-type reverse transcriptase